MIYFLQSPEGGPVKIGTSLRLSSRLKTLGKEQGQALQVLGITKGEQRREKELHGRFAHLRIQGEWFQPGPELLRFIRRSSQPWDGADECPGERKSITTLKGSAEWGAWLERLAEFDRNTIVGLIDRAVAEYAQNHGFQEKPPRR
jgi:hypothetical protein